MMAVLCEEKKKGELAAGFRVAKRDYKFLWKVGVTVLTLCILNYRHGY